MFSGWLEMENSGGLGTENDSGEFVVEKVEHFSGGWLRP